LRAAGDRQVHAQLGEQHADRDQQHDPDPLRPSRAAGKQPPQDDEGSEQHCADQRAGRKIRFDEERRNGHRDG
jgi:hypothetical protein